MIQGKEKEKLKKEDILERVDDYNIISYYLGQDFDFKKKFPSPFRGKPDDIPNLCFFPGDNEKILWKDFANGKGGDCFKFVQEMFHINFHNALLKIDKDFGLGLHSKPSDTKVQLKEKPDSIHKQTKLIQVISRPFTPEDLQYWGSFEISEEELKAKNVFSIEKLYINKKLVPNYSKQIRFAYLFDDYLKIYTPLASEYKWISSCPNDYMSGFDNIKYKVFKGIQARRLIISKSVKDEMVLSKFFKDVCSTQNESSASINAENMAIIQKGYHPEDVFISYDNDEAGVNASLYYTKGYGFSYVNVPKIYAREGIKDWADLVKHKGLKTMENYLKIKKLI